ncbi:hypothetical protein LQ757_07060 [Agromyces sp. SYSU K20354]|uniref:hypothetical protein n=1 Tax=Agromyces cavernae TaxID=2898659 RepID=UPI001E461852|nr:hypothetical protein [Agromyces cavernae]MCD2442036.1 hypothetical protein [Agromyces cavernae]
MTSKPLGTLALVIGVSTLAIVASSTALLIGTTEAYALIFPPRWVTFIAAGLLLASVNASHSMRGTRTATILGWAAAVFFFGASGGAILDGFRAFFLVTGIPAGDFATVDWPGAIARGVNLLAAVATVAWTWRLRAGRTQVASGHSTRAGTALVWLAVAFTLPYPLLKLWLWMQDVSSHTPGAHAPFPALELLAFGAALVLVLLLASSRKPVVPGWLLIVGGWLGSAALLSMGFLMVFGLIAQMTGVSTGSVEFANGEATLMVLCVYGTWLMLGVAVLAATLRFMDGHPSLRGQAATRTEGATAR